MSLDRVRRSELRKDRSGRACKREHREQQREAFQQQVGVQERLRVIVGL